MGILSFINGKNGNSSAKEVKLPTVDNTNVVQKTVDESKDDKHLTVSYATGWPIDVIYGYLHKNYEKEGYDDAIAKTDLAFRDLNMDIIKNKILMVFREIKLNYDTMESKIEISMETCQTAGLLTTMSEFEKKMAIIKAHKEELKHLEDDFRNNANEASIPLKSYECGFLRGIATIALSNNGNSVAMPTASASFGYTKASA